MPRPNSPYANAMRARERARTRRGGCPRCGSPTAVLVVVRLQATRDTSGRKNAYLEGKSVTLCPDCGDEVFHALETLLTKEARAT